MRCKEVRISIGELGTKGVHGFTEFRLLMRDELDKAGVKLIADDLSSTHRNYMVERED